MHTKQVLLSIVVLNIIDCVLVLGELILDIYYLKGKLNFIDLSNDRLGRGAVIQSTPLRNTSF